MAEGNEADFLSSGDPRRRIGEHAEWLAADETAMQRFDVKMLEIEDKLNALITSYPSRSYR